MKPGTRYFSAVSELAVVVVRPAPDPVELACGGTAMGTDAPAVLAAAQAGLDGDTQLGKRYFDEQTGLEVLVTKGGKGTLTVDGRVLGIKQAKPLPASD